MAITCYVCIHIRYVLAMTALQMILCCFKTEARWACQGLIFSLAMTLVLFGLSLQRCENSFLSLKGLVDLPACSWYDLSIYSLYRSDTKDRHHLYTHPSKDKDSYRPCFSCSTTRHQKTKSHAVPFFLLQHYRCKH